ncbi:MAG: class I SAM-dependent methyltransferase [bacterium]
MAQDIVRRFFTGTAPTYDLIVNLFTYGADRYWKKIMLSKTPAAKKILDLACGTGIFTFKLAVKFPASKIVGVDMMEEYIAIAQNKLKNQKRRNVHLICARAEQVRLREIFDCITSSYIPKYVSADKLLGNITPYLSKGGKLILHDFAYPTNVLFQSIWKLHMRLMKMIGAPIFPEWKTIFYELAALVQNTTWISEYTAALPRYGFKNIAVHRFTAGSAAIVSAEKG